MAGKRTNLNAMRESQPVLAPDFARAEEAPEPTGGHRPPLLPQPCPVIPLGVLGKNLQFLDRSNQLVTTTTKTDKGDLKLWFGNDWLIEKFPQKPKGWKDGDPVSKFDQDDAQTALVEDCWAGGIFNPQGKVFGRGAHRAKADDEVLVLHLGRSVLIANEADTRGRRGMKPARHPAGRLRIAGVDAFFPALDTLPAPADKPAERAEGEAVLQLFASWHWAEPVAARLLLLGWLAQAMICGALEWRAHVWLPGPTASGKSSLQKIIRALLQEWCLSTADASEAAIRQRLDNDTIAVSIDEAEAHDNPERLQAVLNLMKKSSSGDMVLRGSADHKAHEFTAQSCFLLSSVLHASMRGEDRNRIAILEMRKLAEDVPPLEMELARWRSAGRRLHRRMIEHWPRFNRTLAAYKRTIGELGFEGRWQDTYGTLLACSDLLLYDFAPDAIGPQDEPGMSRVTDACRAITPLLTRGRSEARTDDERVIVHLMSHMLPGGHGAPPEPVGLWLERAMTPDDSPELPGASTAEKARAKLKTHGLRVVAWVPKPGTKEGAGVDEAKYGEPGWQCDWLAVAYGTNKAVTEVFRGSEWAGDGYRQSLAKIPRAMGPKKVRFAGSLDNALLVPLAALRGEVEG